MSDASLPPALLPDLPHLARQPVAVTGATGTLGCEVVAELVRSNVPVRALVRRTEPAQDGVTQVRGDLTTGEGLTELLDGVGAVIHCATDPSNAQAVDVEGTRRLADEVAACPAPVRLVHVSIIGAVDNPRPYYRAKTQAETAVIGSGAQHCIVRAAQFHAFVHQVLQPRAGFSMSSRQVRFAPVDPAWVAKGLVDVALADELPLDPVEIAGPEVLSAADIVTLISHVRGTKMRGAVRVPTIGSVLKSFARGSNLPGPDARRGGDTFAQWLAARHPTT